MARVLVLTPGFIAPGSGAQVPAVVDLFRGLGQRHDLELHLVTPARAGDEVQAGLTLHGHGSSRAGRTLHLASQLALRPTYDVIWALWLRRVAPWALAVEATLQKPLVASVMGGEVSDLPAIGYGEAGTLLGRRWVEALLGRSSAITVGSPWLERELATRRPGWAAKIAQAPLGVPDLPLKVNPPYREGPLRIVAVTRVEPVKGPELMLQVVARLRAGGQDVSLDLYGYTEESGLRWLAERSGQLGLLGRIHHRGLVTPEVLRAAYADYHLLLHSSLHESQGMALIEAAVVGLPIATTKVGVVPELVTLGAAVEVAEPEAGAMAAAAERAARRIGAGRAEILERYGLGACVARFSAVVEAAARSPRRRRQPLR